MNLMQFEVRIDEIDLTASLSVDLDQQSPAFWSQYDTRGEAVAAGVVQVALALGKQLRRQYDNDRSVLARIEELGR